MDRDDSVLRIEFNNTKPIELFDLTLSFTALAESFKDFANRAGDPRPDNLRLYVKEIRSGSVIADLIAIAEQSQWLLEHAEVFGGFVANTNDLVNYFLGNNSKPKEEPSQRQAKQIAQIVEPVAKDFGSQMNMNVMEGGIVHIHHHQHFTINSMEANAIQNGVTRFLGPQLPASKMMPDQLLVLEQVKNDATSKTGDRGIIEAISSKPVKLQFSSEQAKRAILGVHHNPFECVFQVNVEVRSTGGRPAIYRILDVTEIIEPEQ
ncbi:hypothetical protein [Rhizobium laguerreae]|uniref:hypothetical protein n=1 Tax=Rhizobium TaxID=379 RepID=UPI001C91CE7F|nr:hypothetical protein [Rhizobium laguerreae]MBY3233174.1 hypothetical protein [Rhizobium laguerreae]